MVDGVRWKTKSSPGHLGQLGDRLHCRRSGADDPDALSVEVDVVVPPRRVERVALERLHPADPRQLRRGEDAVGEDHEAGPHGVAAVGEHRPAPGRPRPTPFARPWCGTGSARRSRTARPSLGSTRGSRSPTRTSSTGRSPSPRAAGGSCTTRRRRRCRDSGSSTTCRRRRRPSRRTGRRRTRPRCSLCQSNSPANPAPTTRTSHSSVSASRGTGSARVDVVEVLGELALHRHVVGRTSPGLLVRPVLRLFLGVEHRAGGLLGQHLQRLVRQHSVPRPGDRPVRRGFGVEHLQAGRGIDAHGGSLSSHQADDKGNQAGGASPER